MKTNICVLLTSVVAFFATPQFLTAQTDPAVCQAISPSMMAASDSFATLMGSIREIDFNAIAPNLGSAEAEKFQILAARRDALLPVADEFLKALDEAALTMRACSR